MIPLRYDLVSDRIAQHLTDGNTAGWITTYFNANGLLTVEPLTDEQVAGWSPMAEGVYEHGQAYSSGSVLVFPNDDPASLREVRIESCVRNGGKVVRRKVIVIEDWEEVT